MANASYGGFIAFDASAVDADEPTGVDVRQVLINNAMHACDGAAQSRIVWIAETASHELTFDVDANADASDVWYRICSLAFYAHHHPTNGAFRFRVRIGGRSSSVDASCGFRMYIGPRARAAADATLTTAPDTVVEATGVTATSLAWLTLDGGDTLVTVPEALVDLATETVNVLDAISGREIGIPVCSLVCEVWGTSDDVDTGTPYVGGIVVQEYVGT